MQPTPFPSRGRRAIRSWRAPLPVLWALCALVAPAVVSAADGAAPANDSVAALRAELDALKAEYERRISTLEARIDELEAEKAETPPASEEEDLAALRAAAREAAAETGPAAPRPDRKSEGPAFGHQRDLSRLNPEISMTGNVLGTTSKSAREEFRLQEFELDIQSALDPFSTTRWTLAVGEEGVKIEEGYVSYPSLWRGLGVTAGRFRQRFGPLNRQHLHALPQVEYPLALQTYFAEEGLGQTGLSFDWALPPSWIDGWADATGLVFEVTDGSNEAFGGEDFQQLAYLGRLTNYWDLSSSTYLELGFSGIAGETAAGGDSRVWGADLTVDWAPPSRAKYREILWRTEVMLSQRDDALGVEQEAWGGYSYLEGLLRRNLWAGVRYDRVEDPLEPDLVREAVVPYVTWWQSEYVRLRGEYRIFDDPAGELDDGFVLQLTWAAGPHKHETY